MKLIKHTIIILTITFAFNMAAAGCLAKDIDESTPSSISQEKVKEKIKERLEQVVDEKLEQVKGAIEKKAQEKLYAFAGNLKSIENRLLTLNTFFGDKQVEVATQAAILRYKDRSSDEINIEDINKDEFIIAMGTKKDDILLGKRIFVTTKLSPAEERKFLHGKVTEVDDSTISFSENGSEDTKTIEIEKNTKLKIVGIDKPEIENIQVNDLLRAIVSLNEEGETLEVKTILIIPGETNPAAAENEIDATPSARPEE
jgi:hypothetical protein